MPMTEAAIDTGLTRDLYVSLGEPVVDGDAWVVRVYVKPFIDLDLGRLPADGAGRRARDRPTGATANNHAAGPWSRRACREPGGAE